MADSLGNSFLIIVLPLYIHSGRITGDFVGFSVGETGAISIGLITGIILSSFGFLNSFGQPFTGRLSDSLRRRKIFVITGLGILAVTNFLYSVVGSYEVMFVVRAVQGIGVAFTIPTSIALVNELATDTTRGSNMGVYNTFRLLGFGAGPLVAGGIVEAGPYMVAGLTVNGFNAAFYIASVSAMLSILLVHVLVDDPEELEEEAGGDLSVSVFYKGDGDKLLDPVFTLGVASLFMAVGIALLAAIETHVNSRLGQGSFLFGVEFAAFVGAQVLLQAPIGSVSDRIGRKPFIVAGLVLLVPSTVAQGLVTVPAQMIVARFVQGVAGAMVFAPALALAGDIAKTGESGTQLSVLTMSFGLGIAIGPLSSGFLVDYGYVYPFVFGSFLAAVGAVLVYTQVEDTVDPN
ncbi:MAG: MFS transporter [Halobacteria archaeon]|nr:MFS transporter [Halobacteria archaeon]